MASICLGLNELLSLWSTGTIWRHRSWSSSRGMTVNCIVGLILGISSANERRLYTASSSLTGSAHTENDPWIRARLLLAWSNAFLNQPKWPCPMQFIWIIANKKHPENANINQYLVLWSLNILAKPETLHMMGFKNSSWWSIVFVSCPKYPENCI